MMLLKDSNFLKKITNFEKDKMKPITLRKLEKFINMEDFTPDALASQSPAAASLCEWVRNVYAYAQIKQ